MTEQEQEDRDYMPVNELQNAFSLSQGEFTDDTGKIDEMVRVGRYVVVVESTAYCPRTDAILGRRRMLVADFATPDLAEQKAQEENESIGDTDGEVRAVVYPPSQKFVEPIEPIGEIPF